MRSPTRRSGGPGQDTPTSYYDNSQSTHNARDNYTASLRRRQDAARRLSILDDGCADPYGRHRLDQWDANSLLALWDSVRHLETLGLPAHVPSGAREAWARYGAEVRELDQLRRELEAA